MPFFAHLHPFFASGGRLLLVLPVSEIKNGILQHLQAFRTTAEGVAGETSGGFRFLFVSEYDGESSLCSPALIPLTKTLSTESVTHVKELAIFYPGNLLVKVALTANLSAPAFGLAAMDCLDFADRCAAPQSCKNAEVLLVDCSDPDSIGPAYLESLSEHYLLLGSRGRLIVGVPALESIYRTCFPFLRALTF